MNLKRIIILILLLCVATFALSACGSTEQPSSEPPEQTAPEEDEQPPENTNAKEDEEEQFVNTIYLTIGTHKITVKLEENTATKSLVELLKEGDITYSAHDYGGFEKVGVWDIPFPAKIDR